MSAHGIHTACRSGVRMTVLGLTFGLGAVHVFIIDRLKLASHVCVWNDWLSPTRAAIGFDGEYDWDCQRKGVNGLSNLC